MIRPPDFVQIDQSCSYCITDRQGIHQNFCPHHSDNNHIKEEKIISLAPEKGYSNNLEQGCNCEQNEKHLLKSNTTSPRDPLLTTEIPIDAFTTKTERITAGLIFGLVFFGSIVFAALTSL